LPPIQMEKMSELFGAAICPLATPAAKNWACSMEPGRIGPPGVLAKPAVRAPPWAKLMPFEASPSTPVRKGDSASVCPVRYSCQTGPLENRPLK
jgi:hypothetical protein